MHPWRTDVEKVRLGWSHLQVTAKCVVVQIDRQKKLLHQESDFGDPDLEKEIVACAVPLQPVSHFPQIWGNDIVCSFQLAFYLLWYKVARRPYHSLFISNSNALLLLISTAHSFAWEISACLRHSDLHHVLVLLPCVYLCFRASKLSSHLPTIPVLFLHLHPLFSENSLKDCFISLIFCTVFLFSHHQLP